MADSVLVDQQDPAWACVLESLRRARHDPGGDEIVSVALIIDIRLERDHSLPFSDLDVSTILAAARLAMG